MKIIKEIKKAYYYRMAGRYLDKANSAYGAWYAYWMMYFDYYWTKYTNLALSKRS